MPIFREVQSNCSCIDCHCTPGISDKDFNELTDEEKDYLNKLFQIIYFTQKEHENSDWSTKSIGTFFVKTIIMRYQSFGSDEIHDTFKPVNENVSWPDIALMYNLKNFRVLNETGNELNTPARYLEPEPCDYMDLFCSPGASKRYSIFQSCFKEVSNNYQFDEVSTFRKEDKIEKAIQSFPCQNLEKFPSCSEYCVWHKNFFETIGQGKFIQAMSYASPQRKLYKESMPNEKKTAGKANCFTKVRLLQIVSF